MELMEHMEHMGHGENQKKPSNLKTGLLLGSIALAFFIGLFVKRMWLG